MRRGAGSSPLAVAVAVVAMGAGACARSSDAPETVTVFAAASTADFVTAVATRFEADTGTRVRCSFAASSTLARQIEEGAPADLFLSAHATWMDRLEAADLVDAASRRDLLANGLVLAVPAAHGLGLVTKLKMDHAFDFPSAWPGRIAVGDPDHVPAGMYARQALERLGWWEGVRDRLVPAADVRAAVRLVELGEVQAGLVYASDAVACPGVAVVAIFPPESHDPIRYPVALTRGASEPARRLLEALVSSEAAALRARLGFADPAPMTEPAP